MKYLVNKVFHGYNSPVRQNYPNKDKRYKNNGTDTFYFFLPN